MGAFGVIFYKPYAGRWILLCYKNRVWLTTAIHPFPHSFIESFFLLNDVWAKPTFMSIVHTPVGSAKVLPSKSISLLFSYELFSSTLFSSIFSLLKNSYTFF